MIITAYQDRLRRGRWLQEHGHVHVNGGLGSFDVDSQYSPGKKYQVHIDTDGPDVTFIQCNCPDCQRMQAAIDSILDSGETRFHPGISHLYGDAFCKHEAACMIEMGLLEAQ